jgi:hypothetical protein
MCDEASCTPIWNSTTFQITKNSVLMNKYGQGLRIPYKAQPTKVYGEFLESRFTLKSGVAIPGTIRRTNAANPPPMANVRKLLKVKALLLAIHSFTGAC